MIKKWAERVVDWQIGKSFLSVEERGLYRYAYEVLLNQIVNILIAILIAALFRAPMPVFVFLISYIPIRSYCGGFFKDEWVLYVVICRIALSGLCDIQSNS